MFSQEFVKVCICNRTVFFGQLILNSLFYYFVRQERVLLSVFTEANNMFHLLETRIAVASYWRLQWKACLSEYILMLAAINTLRTGQFKLFKRPLPWFLTFLTL